VGTTVNIGVVVGDEWTTAVNVAVDVKTGDGGGVDGAVGLGPDDAVNDIGGVIVGVGGRPAKDGRPLDRKSVIATTASMTRQLRAWTRVTSSSVMVPSWPETARDASTASATYQTIGWGAMKKCIGRRSDILRDVAPRYRTCRS
jgi:hypothetical protein